MISRAYSDTTRVSQTFISYGNTVSVSQKTSVQNNIVYLKFNNHQGSKKVKSHNELTSAYNKGRYLARTSKPIARRKQMIKTSQGNFYSVGIIV